MQFRILAALLIFLVSLATFVAAGVAVPKCDKDCKKGEQYTTCGTCDPTCDNRNPFCTLQCRVGCYCIKGLVRNKAGRCIPPEKCNC